MLEMGVLPDVAAATAATMIMFTAASASAVYMGFGTVRPGALFYDGVATHSYPLHAKRSREECISVPLNPTLLKR
jgi:hypothetical protein